MSFRAKTVVAEISTTSYRVPRKSFLLHQLSS